MEAMVRQPPYGQKNYQGCCKQISQRRPCGRRKAHRVGSNPRCRSTKNLLSGVKDLPQVGSDKQTGKFEKDSDIQSVQRRTNQQREALPHSTGAKVFAAYDLENQSQGDQVSPSDPEITKETLERGSAANTRWCPKGKNERLALHGR